MTPDQKPAGQTVYGSGDERKEESWAKFAKFCALTLGPCRRNEGPMILDLEIEHDDMRYDPDNMGVAGMARRSVVI